jgi:hypothetical protein
MSFQRPPLLERQTLEPILSVGGIVRDLSNLCSTQNESYSSPPNRGLDRTEIYRDQWRPREQSIYPSKEDLGRHLPADIDTSDIFDRSRSPEPQTSRDVRHRTHQSLPSGTREFDQLNFPNIHRYVQAVSQDRAARDTEDECSDSYYGPQEQDYSRREHGCSHQQVPPDPPPIPLSVSDYSSDASSQRSSRRSVERERTPVQVEVYPGEFLQLRGAKETVEAIERGRSKTVFCYACGLGLRCVADCELVICPDCRIMSPVARRQPAAASLFDDAECEDEDTSYRYRRSLPQFKPLWRDDDESFHSSSKQMSSTRSRNGRCVGSAGGVGLGLRIEN